jgi:DNA-binding CsgD family transcriptional regulator
MARSAILRKSAILRLAVLAVVQTLCAAFFIVELWTDVLGLRHWAVGWAARELLQVGASIGLVLGAFASIALLRQTMQRVDHVERQLRVAAGSFIDVVQEQFLDWGLTPAESEAALFAVRGYANAEIATALGKSEATVKTQLNAVFRKSGLTGRTALVCHFIDVVLENMPAEKAVPPHQPEG